MTWFQLYAFFGAPLLVLAIGLGVAHIAARDLERARRDKLTPGE